MYFSELDLYSDHRQFLLIPKVSSASPPSPHTIQPAQYDYGNVLLMERNLHNRRINAQRMDYSGYAPEQQQRLFRYARNMTCCYGIVGVVNLLSGPYLIAVTKREVIGCIRPGEPVYRVKRVQFFPFQTRRYHRMTDALQEREITYIEMLNRVIVKDNAFYMSYEMDMTRSLQKTAATGKSSDSSRDGPDSTFFWNRYLSEPFIEANLKGFVLPMIRGLVEIHQCLIRGKSFTYGLVTRTGCKRAGTRYRVRGADEMGNVANFAETEQFVQYNNMLASYVLVRGSIPLIWTQTANLSYTPEIQFLDNKKAQRNAFESHYNDLHERYGQPIVSLNLCKKKGQELRISNLYQTLFKKTLFSGVSHYTSFDFHKETEGRNFFKVHALLESLSNRMEEIGFHLERIDNSEQDIEPQASNTNGSQKSPPVPLMLKKQEEELKEQEETFLLQRNQKSKLINSESTLIDIGESESMAERDTLLDMSTTVDPHPLVMNDSFIDAKSFSLGIEEFADNGDDLLNDVIREDFNLLSFTNSPMPSRLADTPASELQVSSSPDKSPYRARNDDLFDFFLSSSAPSQSKQSSSQAQSLSLPSSPPSSSSSAHAISSIPSTPSGTTSMWPKAPPAVSVQKRQNGTVRVNCIDCCDRTNVVQTYLARAMLNQQFAVFGILRKATEDVPQSFKDIFNNVWANNGDRISLLYSGTHALMGDYTRTGSRSVTGLLNDGVNSLTRYVQNNFKDSIKQRSINLTLGLLDLYSKEEQAISQKSGIVNDLSTLFRER